MGLGFRAHGHEGFCVTDMKVYVPRIEDKESHMRMLHITNTDDDLIANYMNILEPTPLNSSGKPREEGTPSLNPKP